MEEWDWFRFLLVAVAAVTFTSATIRDIRTGIARPMLDLFSIEEFAREENAAYFWGIIVFNVILALALVSLLLFILP